MQYRVFLAAMAMAVAAILSQASYVQAGSTLGFDDNGTPTVNTGNINTATIFTIGDLQTTAHRPVSSRGCRRKPSVR